MARAVEETLDRHVTGVQGGDYMHPLGTAYGPPFTSYVPEVIIEPDKPTHDMQQRILASRQYCFLHLAALYLRECELDVVNFKLS